ncbi:MAG TPA: hypothetical protein VH105_21520 [Burkholderiales bacterium]|nr:hypothetical protein [Burkholderiales bacterium]
MENLNDSVNQAATRYSAAAHEKVDKLASSAHPAVDRLAAGAHGAVDRLAEVTDATTARLSKQAEQLKATQQRLSENCGTYVRANPLTALGIAVAAGFVLSRLINSR